MNGFRKKLKETPYKAKIVVRLILNFKIEQE